MNQHTPQSQRQRDRILAYVRAHPESTTKEIRATFNLGLDRIGCCLTRMKAAGLLVSEKLPGDRSLRWSAVEEDQIDSLPMRQTVRQTWEACHMRHWLDVALFGEAVAA
jgi:hypothetical protein